MRLCHQNARCGVRASAAAPRVSEHARSRPHDISPLVHMQGMQHSHEISHPDAVTSQRSQSIPPTFPTTLELDAEVKALIDIKLTAQNKVQHVVLRWLQKEQGRRHRWEPTGVFEPVREEQHSADVEVVQGVVPSCLSGMYIRTGPNPQHDPNGGYCGVDGEAMVHAVLLADGEVVSYCNHWLQTPRYLHEKYAGQNIYLRIADVQGPVGFLVLMLAQCCPDMFPEPNEHKNYQLGNTNITYHHGKLLALMESGVPFQLKVDHESGQVASRGLEDFDGALSTGTCGHPKICPFTGELHTFLSRLAKQTEDQELLTYQVVSPDGKIVKTTPIPTSRGQMMHDFGITKNFAVFVEQALVFDPATMFKSDTVPITLDRKAQCRVLLVRRNNPGAPPMKFDLPRFVTFLHIANTWEVGEWVHVTLCRYGNEGPAMEDGLDISSATAFMNDVAEVYRYSLNLRNGDVEETNLTPGCWTDFPVIPKQHVGQATRYCYSPVNDPVKQAVTHIMKTDMFAPEAQGSVGVIQLEDALRMEPFAREGEEEEEEDHGDMMGGEPQFVARDPAAMAAKKCAYDDGYLVLYATHLKDGDMTSYFMIYNAATMSSTPVAMVKLPGRVPVGLHGTFITSEEFLSQQGESQELQEAL